jgi:hypothetical protein
MVWYAGKVENKKFSITKGILQDPHIYRGGFFTRPAWLFSDKNMGQATIGASLSYTCYHGFGE